MGTNESYKIAITENLCSLHISEFNSMSFDTAFKTWWIDSRPGSGLRLTKLGYDAFVHCGLTCYSFPMPIGLELTAKFLLLLDRKLDCPYYMELTKRPQIILFGKEQAVLFALYGNIEQWMQFLSRK